jgi:EAL domain-containing protein (putative c-di-GMP-specific phosphodiesterase class I)
LNDEQLYSSANPLSPVSSRVVYEITERSELSGITELAGKLRRLRQSDFRIAIDDLGAGHSSLSSFIHLDPDYVKLDMALIRDIHLSANKLSLVRGITRICHNDMGIRIICEGVESADEVQALTNEGLNLFQGYYFAKPAQGFPLPSVVV